MHLRREKEGQDFPTVLRRLFKISHLASVLIPFTGSLGPHTILQSCKMDHIAHVHHETPSPDSFPRDGAILKSPRASFARCFKSGRYQELFHRLFTSNSKTVPIFQAFK